MGIEEYRQIIPERAIKRSEVPYGALYRVKLGKGSLTFGDEFVKMMDINCFKFLSLLSKHNDLHLGFTKEHKAFSLGISRSSSSDAVWVEDIRIREVLGHKACCIELESIGNEDGYELFKVSKIG